MDILAARKKAAERAREQQGKSPAAAPAEEGKPAPEGADVPAAAAIVEPAQETGAIPEPEPLQDTVPAAADAGQKPQLEMLSFRLGSEEYAVLVDDVKEVLKNRELTNVPNAPDHIMGVTSLRGPILPVVDLRKRLGLPAAGGGDEKARILVLTLNDEDTGVVVDRVTGVVRIDAETIRPVPETIEHGAECLKGIARKDERLYILLDIEKTLGV
jgi:purine-binding chemotaxis protein CheW